MSAYTSNTQHTGSYDSKEDQIDKKTLEISQAEDEVYSNLQELGDELPDHSPRFILLSYPLTMVCSISWKGIHGYRC